MQLNMNIATKQEVENSWAFAKDLGRGTKRLPRRARRSLSRCVIIAVSRQARQLGIRPGMRYDEAKMRLPGLRILVSNW